MKYLTFEFVIPTAMILPSVDCIDVKARSLHALLVSAICARPEARHTPLSKFLFDHIRLRREVRFGKKINQCEMRCRRHTMLRPALVSNTE